MKTVVTNELKKKLIIFYDDTVSQLTKAAGIKSYNQFISSCIDLYKLSIDAIDSAVRKQIEKFRPDENNGAAEQIEAQSVIIEVIDQKTGMLYRRNLQLSYLETDNGIILSGESSDGKPSTIAFLSDTALKKINDLTGKGPDAPRCNH